MASMLAKLLNKLRKSRVVKRAQLIKNARVPIIKCKIGSSEMDCDISIGVANGARALELIKRYIAKMPYFRTLVMVIKGILQVTQRPHHHPNPIQSNHSTRSLCPPFFPSRLWF